MGKLFVRERSRVGRGAGMPRFVIVAVTGTDLRLFAMHIRKVELEKLAEETGLEIVYLPRGENADKDENAEHDGGHGHGHGRGQGGQHRGRGRKMDLE